MDNIEIDLIPTKGLWEQYRVKETKFYAVLKELGIERLKQGTLRYIKIEDKKRLDNYFSRAPEPAPVREESRIIPKEAGGEIVRVLEMLLERVERVENQVDRYERYEVLERFAKNEWLMESQQLKQLIQIKNLRNGALWGGFTLRHEKGRWWRIKKQI